MSHIALMMMATVAFTSCEVNEKVATDDTASYESTVKQEKEAKEAYQESIDYALTLPIELFEVADVEVTYAGKRGTLVTETVTRDQTVPIWEAGACKYIESDADLHESTDTAKVVWQTSVMADSIPARIFISARALPKPVKKEHKDKRYNLVAYMGYLYDTGVEVDKEHDPDPNDNFVPHVRMGKQDCFLVCIDVSGSKIDTFIDIANDKPQSLDFTVRREKPGSKRLKDFKNK